MVICVGKLKQGWVFLCPQNLLSSYTKKWANSTKSLRNPRSSVVKFTVFTTSVLSSVTLSLARTTR